MQAVLAGEAWSALESLDYKLRSILKHGHTYKSVEELAESIRTDIGDVRQLLDQ